MECLCFCRGGSLYLEVRILPAQPPSRVVSGSLPALGKQSRRSPEMRLRMVMLLREEKLETPFKCESVRFLLLISPGQFWGSL